MLPTKSDGRIHPNWPYMPIQMQLYVGHQLTNRCSFFFGCWWITIRQPTDTRQSLSYLLILTCQSFNVIRVVHILCISYTFLRSRLIEHTKHLHLNKSRSFIFINLFVTHWTLFVVEYICLMSFSYDIVFFVVIVLKVEHIFICFVFTKSICCGHLTVSLSFSIDLLLIDKWSRLSLRPKCKSARLKIFEIRLPCHTLFILFVASSVVLYLN